MTIDNRAPMTNTDLKMIHILSALGLIAVVDQLVRRSGNGNITGDQVDPQTSIS